MQPYSTITPEPPILQLPQRTTSHENYRVKNDRFSGEAMWEEMRPLKKRRSSFALNSPSSFSTISPSVLCKPAKTSPGIANNLHSPPSTCRTRTGHAVDDSASRETPNSLPSSALEPSLGMLELDIEALTYYPPSSVYSQRFATIDLSTGRIQRRLRRKILQKKAVRFHCG